MTIHADTLFVMPESVLSFEVDVCGDGKEAKSALHCWWHISNFLFRKPPVHPYYSDAGFPRRWYGMCGQLFTSSVSRTFLVATKGFGEKEVLHINNDKGGL
jgi:hypothetical protein